MLTAMEGASSAKKTGFARWWDTISHHPLWAALIAALLAGGIAAHSEGVFGSDVSGIKAVNATHGTESAQPALRATLTPVAPDIYRVAFTDAIGLPRPSEEWENLHARGGIDVGESDFRLTLANQTDAPVIVTSVEAVVYGSQSAPVGTLAAVYTQGAAPLEDFGVELTSDVVGATAQFHRQEKGEIMTMSPEGAPLFFQNHDIRLAPQDVYEAKVAVQSTVSGELDYGFIVTGNTAAGRFSYRLASRFKIAGYRSTTPFARSYWWLPTQLGGPCWIVTREETDGGEPRCP